MEPVVRRSAGLDVHRNSVVATVLIEQEDGTIFEETKEFGTFKKDRRELCAWLTDHGIELVVMESTGIYWKAIYSALEGAGAFCPGLSRWGLISAYISRSQTTRGETEGLLYLSASGIT